MTYQMVSFPVTLNDSNLGFKVSVLFKGEYYLNCYIL